MKRVLAVAGLVVKEIFRKKDFYVALILCAVVLFYASQLEFYNVGRISKYLMEIGLALSFLCSAVLTVALTARQVPLEFQQGTARVLLAKAIHRHEFILGKYLGSLAAGSASFLAFYTVFVCFAFFKAGSLDAGMTLQTFYLFVLSLAILAAMACGLSFYMTVGANVTVTLLIYILINTYGAGLKASAAAMSAVSQAVSITIYYALPHFEFFDVRQRFIHGWEPVAPTPVLFLTLYAAGYAALFLGLGWAGFRRRTL